MKTLSDLALEVLSTADGDQKAEISRQNALLWQKDPDMPIGKVNPPDRPARPTKPELRAPTEMPRRRGGSDKARATLLHAVLHIELNAIDLAWDMVARFTAHDLPREFYDDWVQVGEEEGKHFQLLQTRLRELGYSYGDFAAHDGLWEAAFETRNELLARLAVVPMVLEARGLDVTPGMIARFAKMGDQASVDILKVILNDEIGHVASGNRWFHFICGREGKSPRETWQLLVRKNFRGLLKPPFNEDARTQADLTPDYYLPLTEAAEG
ncbi:ferritin-like domain-containing protein [Sneathiella limimaris]|uniref:ferritin-like domain-containing protein n=1 Tax=Sneathiella limimaris TaxID=1964213 RepID=UPI00146CBED8|nr:ferritin-like domain-containing protein [Sneathiella limimaris]